MSFLLIFFTFPYVEKHIEPGVSCSYKKKQNLKNSAFSLKNATAAII